ncbi:MAG: NTP transferase domain-containing protein [Oscillospiraceae bacterium]|jgi:bifunctional N-acetylglucosamine-1-phosphate-uridyltransferase/glucosamine-1-phosphate-acetyltransferase GlmU-like protein|nr:NTP transferase domain-containing protein [Oscillospiraceae bacterium]
MDDIYAVILAAGLGKRLRTGDIDAPKCLREAGGEPLLSHVLRELDMPRERVILVVGYRREDVTARFPEYTFAVQEAQLGTGHAAQRAEPLLRDYDGAVLVACADMPLLKNATYRELIDRHTADGNDCTILADLYDSPEPPPAFGRIVRENGVFSRIVEARDCTPEQLVIRELNAGLYVFDARRLWDALGRLDNKNAQGELYLTDVPQIIASRGGKVGVHAKTLGDEVTGVNTLEDLEKVDRLLRG